MPFYRRRYEQGCTVFLTVVTYQRQPLFQSEHDVQQLRASLANVMNKMPFEFDAAVILPDHMHFLWTLPPNDVNYSKRIGVMKKKFTQSLPEGDPRRNSPSHSRQSKHESGVWQRRFWEHIIRDDTDFKSHLDYIHYNPVRHGCVGRASDWPYSSFKKWVSRGEYPPEWGTGIISTLNDLEIAMCSGE